MTSSLTKIALAMAAVTFGTSQVDAAQVGQHHQSSEMEDHVQHTRVPLRKTQNKRALSHAEMIQMRK